MRRTNDGRFLKFKFWFYVITAPSLTYNLTHLPKGNIYWKIFSLAQLLVLLIAVQTFMKLKAINFDSKGHYKTKTEQFLEDYYDDLDLW